MNMDILSEEYLDHTPYNYTMNNPIRFTDVDGLYSTEEWKKDNGVTDDDLTEVYNSSDNENSENCCEGLKNFIGGLAKGIFGGQQDAQQLAENGNTEAAQRVDAKIEKQTNDLETYGESLSIIPGFSLAKAFSQADQGNYGGALLSTLFSVLDFGGSGASKGISVIGPRSTYREFAKKIGANFLNVSDEAWTMQKNMRFLQDVVKRGDDVIFAGKFNPSQLNLNSVLAKEINYLQKNGYKWSDNYSKLIKK